MRKSKPLPYSDVFEKLGLDEARRQFGNRTDEVGKSFKLWSKEECRKLDEAASARRDEREEATLEMAKEANRLASEANATARLEAAAASRSARYAMYAAAIAATGAIAANKDQIISVILNLLE